MDMEREDYVDAWFDTDLDTIEVYDDATEL